ncbi:hypothetical protein BN2497_3507 [Janthinobacterium sp. CG23_2]|nr:hypothetical protein BN2497_3507 [Janthinobacterium sp. CG23_2]CUU28151.1 hypothetical protein BN3177_3507 [Janthinobacterium sp. CG23_2]
MFLVHCSTSAPFRVSKAAENVADLNTFDLYQTPIAFVP